ncbi:MAG: hypothetical protein NZO16_07880, partial [Deltaproteobacteria bacterium]|nr:hypothetical protein [Deltaproteobacteria bacterium]
MKKLTFFEKEADLIPVEANGLNAVDQAQKIERANAVIPDSISELTSMILLRHFDQIKNGEIDEHELVELIKEYAELEGLTLYPSDLEQIKNEI